MMKGDVILLEILSTNRAVAPSPGYELFAEGFALASQHMSISF